MLAKLKKIEEDVIKLQAERDKLWYECQKHKKTEQDLSELLLKLSIENLALRERLKEVQTANHIFLRSYYR